MADLDRMTSIRELYGHWRDATQRFDYFVLALTGGLCAYIAGQLDPQRIAWSVNAYNLKVVGLFLLIGSAVAGFLRVERMVDVLKSNQDLLELQAQHGALSGEFRGEAMRERYTGFVLTPEQTSDMLGRLPMQIQVMQEELSEVCSSAERWYRLRNWQLLLGFLLFAVGRLLEPYWP